MAELEVVVAVGAALGLPVVAGQLGALAAARAAGLAVHADHHLNCCSVRTLLALGGLGAAAANGSLWPSRPRAHSGGARLHIASLAQERGPSLRLMSVV